MHPLQIGYSVACQPDMLDLSPGAIMALLSGGERTSTKKESEPPKLMLGGVNLSS